MSITVENYSLLFDGQLSIIFKAKEILNKSKYFIATEIKLSRDKCNSKWMVHLIIPFSQLSIAILQHSALNQFLDLFAKNYLIIKWLLYKMNFPHQMLINSIYNNPNEIMKLCEQALLMYINNNYYFLDSDNLFIDNILIEGINIPVYFYFRENMNSVSKLCDLVSYNHPIYNESGV
jgi:hypothetical protein